ncbi:ADM protein [Camelus dromedarius]|uniref:Pro-adrenomedullin n=3 Tax=Camelus TaxID=9836 RepID=A0A5N4DLK0_CAMDR|nr:ADM protein [Camelus dromedarius]
MDFDLPQGLRITSGMKLVPVALMYLGSLAILGADTARLDVAAEFRKKWNKWALSRGKRELRVSSSYPTGIADVKAGPAQTLVRPQDVKGASRSPQASPDAARIRVKRYRPSMNNFQGLRGFGCRFGTCTVQKLAHQIYQFTDKDKDGVAPRSKISPQGYGRRRRRSLPEANLGGTLLSPEPQARGASASRAQVLASLLKI